MTMSGYLSDLQREAERQLVVERSNKITTCPTCGVILADGPQCSTVLHRLAHRSARLRDHSRNPSTKET